MRRTVHIIYERRLNIPEHLRIPCLVRRIDDKFADLGAIRSFICYDQSPTSDSARLRREFYCGGVTIHRGEDDESLACQIREQVQDIIAHDLCAVSKSAVVFILPSQSLAQCVRDLTKTQHDVIIVAPKDELLFWSQYTEEVEFWEDLIAPEFHQLSANQHESIPFFRLEPHTTSNDYDVYQNIVLGKIAGTVPPFVKRAPNLKPSSLTLPETFGQAANPTDPHFQSYASDLEDGEAGEDALSDLETVAMMASAGTKRPRGCRAGERQKKKRARYQAKCLSIGIVPNAGPSMHKEGSSSASMTQTQKARPLKKTTRHNC